MKTTVETIDTLANQLRGTIEVCASSIIKKQIITSLSTSVSALNDTVAHLLEHEKRKYIAARKALTVIQNSMSSMHDGLVEGDLSLREFRAANKNLAKRYMPQLAAAGLLAEAEAQGSSTDDDSDAPLRPSPITSGTASKIKVILSASSELKDAVNVVTVSSSGPIVSTGSTSEIEALAQQARAALPIRLPGDFQVVRVPIVPIFPNMELTKSTTLQRLGIKHTVIEGFVVLLDQILLNVSKSKSSKSSSTPLAVAHSVIELLNERGAMKYEIVSDTPNANPRNTDLLMFWVIPRTKMSGMMRTRLLGMAQGIIKWGLPLPSDRAEGELARLEERRQLQKEEEDERQTKADLAAIEHDKREEARHLAKERQRAAKQNADRGSAIEKKQAVRLQEQRRTPAQVAPKAKKAARTPNANPALEAKLKRLVQKNQELHGKQPGKKKR